MVQLAEFSLCNAKKTHQTTYELMTRSIENDWKIDKTNAADWMAKKDAILEKSLSLKVISEILCEIVFKILNFNTKLTLHKFTKWIKIVELNFEINKYYFRFSFKSQIIIQSDFCDNATNDKRHLSRHLKVNEKLQIMENALIVSEKPKQTYFRIIVIVLATQRITFFPVKNV